MSELGKFLEVVYGPKDAFHTVQGTLRKWRNRDIAENASGGGRTLMGRRMPNTDVPGGQQTIETTDLAFSIGVPGRVRIERKDERKDEVRGSLVVVNSEQWWFRDHQGHVEMGDTNPSQRHKQPVRGLTDIDRHFFTSSLREYFVALTLEPLGLIQTAGQNCVRLRAIPRPGAQLWPHWLPYGAEEYEFHADPERGALLYVAGRIAGKVFDSSEVMEVKFDEPLDDSLFTYTPAYGEQVRPADVISEHLTLEAAIVRMPFVVLVPARSSVLGDVGFELMYQPPSLRSQRAYLCMVYRGNQRLFINQAATADPEFTKLEWESIEYHGKKLAMSDPGSGAGMRIVVLEQSRTHVTILSDLDREKLIEVAGSLVPATQKS